MDDFLGSTPLGELAVKMHEFFLSLTTAGFTDDQAIKLIVGMSQTVKVAADGS